MVIKLYIMERKFKTFHDWMHYIQSIYYAVVDINPDDYET